MIENLQDLGKIMFKKNILLHLIFLKIKNLWKLLKYDKIFKLTYLTLKIDQK